MNKMTQHPVAGSVPQTNVSCRNLTRTFGQVAALAGVSLDIPTGQQVAVMGPSGSGKSTLLHCLAGVLSPSSGDITVDNQPVSVMSDAQRSQWRLARCGFVFQDGQLVPELSARENVAIPLLLLGVDRAQATDLAQSWLTRLGLQTEALRRPGELSGGQAQRVAIARALVHRPAVVFADEPTGAVDQATGHEIMQILTSVCAMSGTTLLVVTHDMGVAQWCSRLIEIRDGLVHSDRPLSRGGQQ